MKNYGVILISILLFGIIFTSCSPGEADLLIQKPLDRKLNQYSNFVFTAESGVTEDIQNEVTDLDEIVIERVKDLHLWKTVLNDTYFANDESLIVKAIISDINTVSFTSKFMFGVFAGNASVIINVLFIDGKTGDSIGEYTSSYEGGTTSDCLGMAVDRIIGVISDNFE